MSGERRDDAWGVCNVCKEVVTVAERDDGTHPCPNYYVGYGWYDFANPRNEPWVPGYRFVYPQLTANFKRRRVHNKEREYLVYFRIDQDGILQWIGGVKPSEVTISEVEDMYMRGRPGSNY